MFETFDKPCKWKQCNLQYGQHQIYEWAEHKKFASIQYGNSNKIPIIKGLGLGFLLATWSIVGMFYLFYFVVGK